MSRYMEIRFHAFVKEEYRKLFEPIALEGKWSESTDSFLKEFGEYMNADNVFRCSVDSYVKRWNQDTWHPEYNVTTGEWKFHTKMNMYWSDRLDIQDDLQNVIIPTYIEKLIYYETWYEDDNYNQTTVKYELIDNQMKRVGIVDEDGIFIPFKNRC